MKVGNLVTPSDCREHAVTDCFPSELRGKFAANRCNGKHTELYKRTQACHDVCMLLVKTITKWTNYTFCDTSSKNRDGSCVSIAVSWDRCCIYGTHINIWTPVFKYVPRWLLGRFVNHFHFVSWHWYSNVHTELAFLTQINMLTCLQSTLLRWVCGA
jgi:hypothetical protein